MNPKSHTNKNEKANYDRKSNIAIKTVENKTIEQSNTHLNNESPNSNSQSFIFYPLNSNLGNVNRYSDYQDRFNFNHMNPYNPMYFNTQTRVDIDTNTHTLINENKNSNENQLVNELNNIKKPHIEDITQCHNIYKDALNTMHSSVDSLLNDISFQKQLSELNTNQILFNNTLNYQNIISHQTNSNNPNQPIISLNTINDNRIETNTNIKPNTNPHTNTNTSKEKK